jgi:hypothetical protein
METFAAISFKVVLKEVVSHLIKKSTSFKRIKNIDIDESYLKAANVENVKTIWQIDRSVNLNSFYYPSKIVTQGKTIPVNSMSEFPENAKMVIQGTAGQGKSIFLRYLAGQELRTGKHIPLFVELRKISEKTNIESLIISSLNDLGIDANIENIDHVFSSGKCSILLDAFDEIPEPQVKESILYIESICSRQYNLRMLITARPNSEIQKSTHFRVVDLKPLTPSDFKPILSKFFENDTEIVNEIMEAINKSTTDIKNLIKTPLLLTLLTITYKSHSKIPQHLHEFYENLFHLLANRHDSTKPGFKREFKTKLTETQLEELFCAFSFHCMLSELTSLSRAEAIDNVEKSKKLNNLPLVSADSFLSDCQSNTCLIIHEGFSYHFIHKSIREYHAAKFISKSPQILKEKFYALAINNFRSYAAELKFLSQIDNFFYLSYFLIPKYEKIFQIIEWDGETYNTDLDGCIDCTLTIEAGKIIKFSSTDSLFGENFFDLSDKVSVEIFNHATGIIDEKLEEYEIDIFELPHIDELKREINGKIKSWLRNHTAIYNEHKSNVENTKKVIDELF